MQPRIYTYKITFEEIPHWYWGVHKEKKFGETYFGSPTSNKWYWDFYTPRIQILEFFPFTNEGWKEANLVEDRLIKPDLNNPFCLNEACGSFVSLEFASRGGKVGGKKGMKKMHEEKDEEGKSVNAVKGGKKGAEKVHEIKNGEGKSVHAVKGGEKSHKEKNEEGKSVHALRCNEIIHADKNEEGKSKHALEMVEKSNKQVWESLIDGFRGRACSVVLHNKANGWDPAARVRVA